MDWRATYTSKITTAEEAIKAIKSNSRVVLGHAAGIPVDTVRALVAAKDSYKNVEIVHMYCLGAGEYLTKEMEGHFRHNALLLEEMHARRLRSAGPIILRAFFMRYPDCLPMAHWMPMLR